LSKSSPNPYASPTVTGEGATAPRRGSLLVIFLTVFVDLLGFGMVLPLLPVYGQHFAEERGYSRFAVGLVVGGLLSSFSLMQFLFVPVWGRLSDRYGRRPILIIGLVGSTVFYTLFGVATAMGSLTGLFLSRIGAGIAGATIATAQAYIADTTTKEKRNRGMALIGAAFALGFTLGPTLGAVSLLAGGDVAMSPWPGYVAGGFSGVALLMAIFLLPESLRPGSEQAAHKLFDTVALRSALATPSVALLLLTSFIAVFSFANFESTLSRQVAQLAEEQPEKVQSLIDWAKARGYENERELQLIVILIVFIYLGVVLTLAQGVLVRRLASKMSEGRLAQMGGALAIVGFALLGMAARSSSFSLLLVAMAIEVTGFAMVNPSLQSLISRRSDPTLQGGILGLAQSSSSLARILGPLFGNLLFAYSVDFPYWASSLLMIAALFLMIRAARGGQDYSAE
jgi:DHA1 family tetracycline resistance protein-like MFS transporter